MAWEKIVSFSTERPRAHHPQPNPKIRNLRQPPENIDTEHTKRKKPWKEEDSSSVTRNPSGSDSSNEPSKLNRRSGIILTRRSLQDECRYARCGGFYACKAAKPKVPIRVQFCNLKFLSTKECVGRPHVRNKGELERGCGGKPCAECGGVCRIKNDASPLHGV